MARLIKGTFDNRSSKMLLNLQKFSRQNTKSILFVHYFKNFEFLPFFTELANAAASHAPLAQPHIEMFSDRQP